MTTSEVMSKGSILGLAMVCVSSGITEIVRNELVGGIILLVFGYGFIMWREYLKLRYKKRAIQKSAKRR